MIDLNTVVLMIDKELPLASQWVTSSHSFIGTYSFIDGGGEDLITNRLRFYPDRLRASSHSRTISITELAYEFHTTKPDILAEYVVKLLAKGAENAVRETYADSFNAMIKQLRWCYQNVENGHFEPCTDKQVIEWTDRGDRLFVTVHDPEDDAIFHLRWS